MKGFIEVTDADGNEILINVSAIQVVINAKLFIEEKSIDVKETYAELKALIEAATDGISGCGIYECPYNPNNTIEPDLEEPPCADCDCPFSANKRGTTSGYEITGFNGTRDSLNNLGIRKEK